MKAKDIISSLPTKNYKAFLLFLFLTMVLWFAIQMTKTYTFESQFLIKIDSIPKHIAVDSLDQKFNITIESNGLKLWQYNLSEQSYVIPYKKLGRDSTVLKLQAYDVRDRLTKEFGFDAEKVNFDKDILYYPYNTKDTKRVPVKALIDLTFSPGYNTLMPVDIKPDSVQLSGSEAELKKINLVKTEKISLNRVNDTIRKEVILQSPSSQLELSTSKVSIYLPVEKFSENALMVDIDVLNVPDSLELNIFPDKAKVSFLVALKRFDKVSNLDFKVICDYQTRYSDEGIMIPRLSAFPDDILNPKLHINKVDYLIRQKP